MSAARNAVLSALRQMDEYDGDDADVNLHELADLLEAVTQPLVDLGVFDEGVRGWNPAARAAALSGIIDLVRAMDRETEAL